MGGHCFVFSLKDDIMARNLPWLWEMFLSMDSTRVRDFFF